MTYLFIANNCAGGFIDWIFNRQHLHPWIFSMMDPISMITLYENINNMNFEKFNISIGINNWKGYNYSPDYIFNSSHIPDQDKVVIEYENGVQILYPHNNIDNFEKTYFKRLKRFYEIYNKSELIFLYETYRNEPIDVYYRFLKLSNQKILVDNKNNYHKIHKIQNLDYFTYNSFHQILYKDLKNKKILGGPFNDYIIKKYIQ